MRCVFVTGGIGSGKSLVSELLRDSLQNRGYKALIENMDDIAKSIYNIDDDLRIEIQRAFGKDCYCENLERCLELDGESFNTGNIDTNVLASRVFKNSETISLINSIVHPRVYEYCRQLDLKASIDGVKFVIKESALYPEVKVAETDILVLVSASKEKRLQRVLRSRVNSSRMDVLARMDKQTDWDSAELRKDFVFIFNNDNDDLEDLKREISLFIVHYLEN